jgi:hypothetical protein
MPREIASLILRRSVGTATSGRSQCACCRRIPLTGETLHVLESERVVCQLCLTSLRARDGEPVRTERVHAADRPLAVMPHAA